MSYTLYGIKNCDTMKKAFRYLDEKGLEYAFVDYKKQPPTPEDIDRWKNTFGDWPVNKRGTTYRQIKTDFEQADDAQKRQLLVEHSSAIKRPILEGPNTALLGFTPEDWPT